MSLLQDYSFEEYTRKDLSLIYEDIVLKRKEGTILLFQDYLKCISRYYYKIIQIRTHNLEFSKIREYEEYMLFTTITGKDIEYPLNFNNDNYKLMF